MTGSAYRDAVDEYDAWFERHPLLFESELRALSEAMPHDGNCLDIGAGTGRFAAALGIKTGLDPSPEMAAFARKRGVDVREGHCEAIPFTDASFDCALLVTVDCFLSDLHAAFTEIRRVLKPGGILVIGMIDGSSARAAEYARKAGASKFYAEAHFHSPDQIAAALSGAGFERLRFWQTLAQKEESLESPLRGIGHGAFVVVRAERVS